MTAFPLTSGLLIGSRRSMRLIERNLLVYKHGWLVILSGSSSRCSTCSRSGSGWGR